AHDHPGAKTARSSLLAVAYGPGPLHSFGFFHARFGDTPRYDLGLIEFLFTVVVALMFAATWNKRLPLGSYVIALPALYAPVRFALDFLRLDDNAGGDLRYDTLTPTQYTCFGLLAC